MKTISTYLSAAALIIGTGFGQIRAEFTEKELANSGLELQWESNIGGSPLANGAESLKFWAHTTRVKEVVRFFANGKLIKTFNSDDVDDLQLESAILSGKSGAELPKLGLAGAKEKAEKLSTLYKKIGRTTEVQTEVSKSYYAIAVSDIGIITALDAETGIEVWRRQLPSPNLPITGPAVSDEYVATINGHEFLVHTLDTGSLVARRRLKHVATGRPLLIEGKVAIPSTGGRLVLYDILDANVAEEMLRIGTENRIGVAKSTDSGFIAWPMQNKLVVAKLDEPPAFWYNFDAGNGSDLPSLPVSVPEGFLVASHNGTVSRFGLDRHNPLVWKSLIGTSCIQSPVAGTSNVAVVSQDNRLFLMDLKTGALQWRSPVQGISNALTVTSTHVFALDTAKNLVTIDVKNATVKARVFVGNRTPISNSSTDRVVFADPYGMLSCLREIGAELPTLVAPYTKKLTEEENAAKQGATEAASNNSAEEATSESDEFDASDFGSPDDADPQDSDSEDEVDPFGAF